MSSTLRSTIADLAEKFAASVVDAIRGASLEEILSDSGPYSSVPARRGASYTPPPFGFGSTEDFGALRAKGGRLNRRTADDIAGLVENIVELLAAHPEGLRAEQIRDLLGLEAKELPRPLAEALRSKRIQKQGQKRATTYFARTATSKAKGTGKAGGAKDSGRRSTKAAGAKRGAKAGSRSSDEG